MKRTPQRSQSLSRSQWTIRLGALLLVLGLGFATARAAYRPPMPENTQRVSIPVEDMDCHVWCPIQIDDALGNVPGVYNLFVDVDRGLVTAQVDTNKVEAGDLAHILRNRGWKVPHTQDQ